jgi:hypothetical protein
MNANAKVSMRHGRAVMAFPLRPSGSNYVVPASLEGVLAGYKSLLSIADAALAKAEAVGRDGNLTPKGRTAAMRDWLRAEGAAALRQGVAALKTADDRRAAIRTKMAGAAIDKADVAGAMLRGEVRAWLRSLDPSKRTAMTLVDGLDPSIALAITEAPPELSGVTPEQRERLQTAALVALNPEAATELAEVESALEAVQSAMRAAKKTIQSAAGVASVEIDELLGGPSLGERLAALLVEEPVEESA